MIDELKDKAKEFIQSDKSDELVKKATDAISGVAEKFGDKSAAAAQGLKEKATEFLNSDKGKEVLDKAKEAVANGADKVGDIAGNLKDKAEDIVKEKTGGKGIFGFGKEEG